MTTKYEIPTFIRNKEKSLPSLQDKERHHALGYANQSLKIIASSLRSTADILLDDITDRELLATDVGYAQKSIDEAVSELRSYMLRLQDTKDFVLANLTETPRK